LGTETVPLNALKRAKWDTKISKAFGLIKMSISGDLQFHLQGIETPYVAWKKIETVFGKPNEIRAHYCENQLIVLDPNYFSCIKIFISNFKKLRLSLT